MIYRFAKVGRLSDLINMCISIGDYKTYLELGLCAGKTFKQVVCQSKTSVDNRHLSATYHMTTDYFFEQFAPSLHKYDIIFIDACHQMDYVTRDIANSLEYLEEGGLIITHDTLPDNFSQTHYNGCGTAYISFAKLRAENKNLRMCSLDLNGEMNPREAGIGLIQKGTQDLYHQNICNYRGPNVTDTKATRCEKWDFYEKNKKELMNIIKLSEFEGWLNGA